MARNRLSGARTPLLFVLRNELKPLQDPDAMEETEIKVVQISREDRG
jgi:hypothetical protein